MIDAQLEINIISIFPKMFSGPFSESILKRAQEKKLLKINIMDLRDYTDDKHRTVDDYSYGGGPGMVLKPQPIYRAIRELKKVKKPLKVLLTSAQGNLFNQKRAMSLAKFQRIAIICGRYEGIDDRIARLVEAEEISIGNFVVSGGELPAMVIVDTISRMIPGVIGKEESIVNDSFYGECLDYPHYTRPDEFQGMMVPEVLLSGNHAKIEKWRKKQSFIRTLIRRPEIFINKRMNKEEMKIIEKIEKLAESD